METPHNAEIPQTMAVGVVNMPVLYRPDGAAEPTLLLLPVTLAQTDHRTQTVRPHDTAVARTDDRTQSQNLTETTSITSRRSATSCRGVDVSQHPDLQTWLPPGYDYHVCSVEERPTEMDHSALCATVRLPLKTEEEIKEWFLKTRGTPVTWRVRSKTQIKGQKVIYKKLYKCQHNTTNCHARPAGTTNTKRPSKNTNCPASLNVTLKTDIGRDGRVSRSKDSHMPQYPTVIILKNTHNHNLYEAGALRHRDVGPKAIQTLTRIFQSGVHSPKAAHAALQKHLKAEYGDKYIYASADRAICPELKFCYSLRDQVLGKTNVRRCRRQASSMPKSQKKKEACPGVQQCVTADEEQIDDLMQGQSSQQNPSQGGLTTNHEECEAASAADFLCMSVPSDYEDDTEDLVESMIRDISSLRKDPIYGQAIAAMAKQFHLIKSEQLRLLSAMHCFGNKGQTLTSSRRTAAVRPGTTRPGPLSPCQPTATPRPVTKLSSKRRLSSGGCLQTNSRSINRQQMIERHRSAFSVENNELMKRQKMIEYHKSAFSAENN